MRISSWRGFLVCGLGALALYFLLPNTEPMAAVGSVGFAWASAVAVVVGVRRHRPASRGPWYLIATALLAIGAGDVLCWPARCETWPTSAS